MSLKDRLIEQIAQEGPVSVADYMAMCLLDPFDGYYTRHPALGVDGDFLTAPLVSQMFGEMIGIWVAQMWRTLGSPSFRLVEVGGGDGTLMSDILRVARQVPGLFQAAEVVMIEPSPVLRMAQGTAVPGAIFLPDLNAVPDDRPVILIANEVLDCLPARQYVRTESGWAERCVGVRDGALAFGLVPAEIALDIAAEPGQIVEVSPAQRRFAEAVAAVLKSATGAALLIDYGHAEPALGDTLQALYRHQKRDPLEAPGEHDLTVWADFPMLRPAGVATSPILAQSVFLKRLGMDARLAALQAKNPDQAGKLQRQYDRLTAPDQMGELFKVIAFAFPPDLPLFALEAADPTP